MLIQRVAEDSRPCKHKIPTDRWEYQDSLPSLPLTGAELRVLLYLLKCGARTGEAWPKHQTIARVCRCHQDTARRATKRLEELGLIRIVRGRTFNRYRFPWHVGFSRSQGAATSDLPPYKAKQESEPTLLNHNPALEAIAAAELAAEGTVAKNATVPHVNVTRGAYYGGALERGVSPAYLQERRMPLREDSRQQPST